MADREKRSPSLRAKFIQERRTLRSSELCFSFEQRSLPYMVLYCNVVVSYCAVLGLYIAVI